MDVELIKSPIPLIMMMIYICCQSFHKNNSFCCLICRRSIAHLI